MRLKGKFRATDDLDMGGHHVKDWRYLADIPQGGATDGQVLTWDGEAWSPQDATGGSGGVVRWVDVEDKPTTFPPEAHTHPLSSLTQSSATAGQVATWNGTLGQWVPATPGASPSGAVESIIAGTGIVVSTSIGDVTITCNLTWSELANKPATFPPSAHTHPLSDLTQSGATAGQVATWNSTAGSWVPDDPPTGSTGVTSIAAGTGVNVSTSVGAVTITCDLTWSELADKPTTFTPAAHTHSLSDITQSGAAAGQVATWDSTDSAWEPRTPTVATGFQTIAWAYKTGDETRNNTTNGNTPALDTDLQVTLVAGKMYAVESCIRFSASTAGDIAVKYTLSTTTYGNLFYAAVYNGVGVIAFNENTAKITGAGGGTNAMRMISVRGLVEVTAATNVTLQIFWSNDVATAGACVLYKGSYLSAALLN